MKELTFPSAPVLRQIELQFTETTAAARALGVHRVTIMRWRDNATPLRERTADLVAIRLGCHPIELWPDWYAKQEDRESSRLR